MEDLSLRSRLTPYPGLGRSMGCNSRTSHSLLPGPLLKRLAAAACRIHSEPLTSVGLVMLLWFVGLPWRPRSPVTAHPVPGRWSIHSWHAVGAGRCSQTLVGTCRGRAANGVLRRGDWHYGLPRFRVTACIMDRRGSSACGPLTDSFGLVEGRVAKLGAIVVVGWRSLESQANWDQALPPLLDVRSKLGTVHRSFWTFRWPSRSSSSAIAIVDCLGFESGRLGRVQNTIHTSWRCLGAGRWLG